MKSSAKNMKQSASQMQSLRGLSESQRLALLPEAERMEMLKEAGRKRTPMSREESKAFSNGIRDAINNQPRPKS